MAHARFWGVMLGLIAVGLAAPGCREQQLEERNLILQRQLEQALVQNVDLQQRVAALEAQPPAPPPIEPMAPEPELLPPPTPRTPDFGPDVQVRQVGETMTVTLPNKVLFASGSAKLLPQSKTVLSKVAGVLKTDYAGHVVRVAGHTDNEPIKKSAKYWQDNWELSCERALSVLRYLVEKGVDAKRISATGYAYHRPVASNATAVGRAKNRRVELVVSPR